MDRVDGRPLQNLTMQMLWKILCLIFLEIGHRLGLADSPPTSPVCPDEPEDPEAEEPDDGWQCVGRGWGGCALCHRRT